MDINTLKYFPAREAVIMGEITIRLKVPDGMEEKVKKAVEDAVKSVLHQKKLRREVLDRYFGRYPGEIREEEWYYQ